MDKNELLNMIMNDEEIRDAIFSSVVNHPNFNSAVEDANSDNDYARDMEEASAWV